MDVAAPRVLKYVLANAIVDRSVLSDGRTPSVRKASASVARLLLDHGADPSIQQSLALKFALASQELGLAGWLLDAGAVVSDLDASAVIHALGDSSLFKRLLRAGVKVEGAPLTPLLATKLCNQTAPEDLFTDGSSQNHSEEICAERLHFAEEVARVAATNPGASRVLPTVWLAEVLAASPFRHQPRSKYNT